MDRCDIIEDNISYYVNTYYVYGYSMEMVKGILDEVLAPSWVTPDMPDSVRIDDG